MEVKEELFANQNISNKGKFDKENNIGPKEKFIDFEKYVHDSYGNHLKILQRSSFEEIQRPIFIAFNHFREKCYHHLHWLELLYKLSQKYGAEIDFIVADQMDMDVIFPHTNPICYFNSYIRAENESIRIFVRDSRKRMLEFFDSDKSKENLMELCDDLLAGTLFISQPIGQQKNKEDSLIKICVHQNFNELVMDSNKNILLIIDRDDYQPQEEYKPNFEQLAREFENSNLDFVYIDGDHNYIPFEYYANSYPTILYIDHEDKKNYMRFTHRIRDTGNLRKFIQQNMGAQGKQLRQENREKSKYKPFTLPQNGEDITLPDLQKYLNENFQKSFEILNRHKFPKRKKWIIIYFMDFKRNDLEYHLQTLQLIHQVAHGSHAFRTQFLVADLQDIEVIYAKWYHKYMAELQFDPTKPQIYVIDFLKKVYKIEETFKTPASLCSFLIEMQLQRPKEYTFHTTHHPETCYTVDNFHTFFKNLKCNIFLAVADDGESKEMQHLSKILNEIAKEFRREKLKFLKIEAQLNCLPLEYQYPKYPVYFFIPENNPEENTIRHISRGQVTRNAMEVENTGGEEEFNSFFSSINLDSGEESSDDDSIYTAYRNHNAKRRIPLPPQEPPQITEKKFVDFKKYVRENCKNKIKILDRRTFHQIEKPIIIAFNHFDEKCYYHTDKLDRLYHLALEYEGQIEFIVADIWDKELFYPHTNPLRFYCKFVAPEDENIKVFAIDQQKRVYEHFDAYNSREILRELCENLLSGKLFKTQAMAEPRNDSLVKICVHSQFKEMVLESSKDILLILGMGDYRPDDEYHLKYEPNYEQIARDFENSNVEIVYMDGDKNFVDFKYNLNCYPTIIFIPHRDKENFMPYARRRDTESLCEFIKLNIQPQSENWRKSELAKCHYKPLTLPKDIAIITRDNLKQYLDENYPQSIRVLERQTFSPGKTSSIIYFLNFQKNGIHFYEETFRKIHYVASTVTGYWLHYYIADLQDIEIIFPPWYKQYIDYNDLKQTSMQVYAKDRQNFFYKTEDFKTPAQLFYYSFELERTKHFHSLPWAICRNSPEPFQLCVAHNLKIFIGKSKKHIFLTIYWSSYRRSAEILNILNEITPEVKQENIAMFIMDAKYNSVPLEYIAPHHNYPVHFFIPKLKKSENTRRYAKMNSSKEDILEFIRTNLRMNS